MQVAHLGGIAANDHVILKSVDELVTQYMMCLLISAGNGQYHSILQRFGHPASARADAATNGICLLKIRVVSIDDHRIAERNSITQHVLMDTVPLLGVVQKFAHPCLILDVGIQLEIRTLVDLEIKILVSRFVLAKSTGLRRQDGREQHKQQHGQAD